MLLHLLIIIFHMVIFFCYIFYVLLTLLLGKDFIAQNPELMAQISDMIISVCMLC